MALTKPTQVMWFNINEYVKIVKYNIEESWIDSEWKFYTSQVEVKFYTNENKEYEIPWKITHYTLQWLRQKDITLEWVYEHLKLISEFEWYNNI